MAIEVTVRDTETDESETQTIENDYVLVTAGSCHAANVQAHANGTHVLTVKGRQDPVTPIDPADPDVVCDRLLDDETRAP